MLPEFSEIENIPQPVPADGAEEPQTEKYWVTGFDMLYCSEDCPAECGPQCPVSLETHAREYLRENNPEKAAELLLKAVEIEPEFPNAWELLGAYYNQTGNYEKAFDAYGKSMMFLASNNRFYGRIVAAKNLKKYDIALKLAEYCEVTAASDLLFSPIKAEIAEEQAKA